MKNANKLALAGALGLFLCSGPAVADTSALRRVEQASTEFVLKFNAGDSEALGSLYTRSSILKLPNQVAVFGRDGVVAAWQAGFDGGLANLTLDVEVLEMSGPQRAVESGTYRLEIRTPNGTIVQTGTFAVQWKVPRNIHKTPKIIFDAIDAD